MSDQLLPPHRLQRAFRHVSDTSISSRNKSEAPFYPTSACPQGRSEPDRA
jgi:hypothetical protein